jgi:hypothetical protein
MATLLVAHQGAAVKIEGVSNPADPDAQLLETGALLPGPDATLAGPRSRNGSTPRSEVALRRRPIWR